MNKSTPISELPNLKRGENSNAYEEKENQIVSEILNEIDNSNKENMNIQEPNINHQESPEIDILEQQQQQQQQQQLIEQQNTILSQESNNRKLEETLNSSVNDNMINNIINKLKQPLIVAVVIALISIPKIGDFLITLLSGKEKLAPYATLIILVIKSLLGASMFYGINMNL